MIVAVKLGTNTTLDETGEVRAEVLHFLFAAIKEAQANNIGVFLITSGAVALGRSHTKDQELDRNIAGAIGQMNLSAAYYKAASEFEINLGQILLAKPHIQERKHFLRIQEMMQELLDKKIVPIINEDDALVADTDWSFGDNDSLAAATAVSFGSKELIICTHVDGLYTADPTKDSSAKFISEIKDVNRELLKYCDTGVSAGGRGGMISKLKAARTCTNVGVLTRIINGLEKDSFQKAFDQEKIGTVCLPREEQKISNRERWIIAAKSSAASIEIDDGAARALQSGKSLLAVGIKKIYGNFEAGESVEIVDNNQDGLAFGIADVSSLDLNQKNFKEQKGVQVMHADNIIVFL